VLTKFESILHKHFKDDKNSLITVGDIASQLSMSTHYLSDLLRNLTGMNTQQHIHAHLIEKAKSLLLTTNLSVNPPVHLLVGKDAYQIGKQSIQERIEEMGKWKAYSEATDYDSTDGLLD
jgi:AraC-like DNA-binding protein